MREERLLGQLKYKHQCGDRGCGYKRQPIQIVANRSLRHLPSRFQLKACFCRSHGTDFPPKVCSAWLEHITSSLQSAFSQACFCRPRMAIKFATSALLSPKNVRMKA